MSGHAGHQPRKRFGQHFLHDAGIIDRLLRYIQAKSGDQLVEIGPGLGALTAGLLAAAGRLHAVELDRDLVAALLRRYPSGSGLTVHHADALKFDFCSLAPRPDDTLRVVGNLPYNISTPIIFHLLDQLACIADMHFMLQREVVRRLAASPGGKQYGRLSVIVQLYCRVEKCFDIGPGAFTPPPKVESSLVRLTPYRDPPVVVSDPARFAAIVRAAFSQRRKTLRNSLRAMMTEQAIAHAGIDPGARPESLGVAQFAALADAAP